MSTQDDLPTNPRASVERYRAWRDRKIADPEYARMYLEATAEIERIDDLVRGVAETAYVEGEKAATDRIANDLHAMFDNATEDSVMERGIVWLRGEAVLKLVEGRP